MNARRSPNFASFAVAAPAPEGAFLGLGQATIITPLKQAQRNARLVVAVDDLTAAQRLAGLLLDGGADDLAVDVDVVLPNDVDRIRRLFETTAWLKAECGGAPRG